MVYVELPQRYKGWRMADWKCHKMYNTSMTTYNLNITGGFDPTFNIDWHPFRQIQQFMMVNILNT